MPELPEVRAHAERLAATHTGAILADFRPLSFTALKTATPSPGEALGSNLRALTSRGKHLLLAFGDPSPTITFVIHLMQGGRLRSDPQAVARPRGGLARWTFEEPPTLLLTEAGTEKKAGIWVVDGDPERQEPLVGLGPDADRVDRETLAHRLGSQSKRLHTALRDQRVLAGLGRRLANEVCFRARLSPFALTATLDEEAVARLHDAIATCVAEGLLFERDLDDMSSAKERPGAVHHRQGQPCEVCGDSIRTVTYAHYTVAYCPTCQTNGKVLADNTTSRFLR